MAFTIENLFSDGDIEVILRADGAIKDTLPEDYEKYLETLDESHLTISQDQEPTRFVLRKTIPLKHAQKIENSKVKFDKNGEPTIQIGYLIDDVRASLKGIKYGNSVPKEKQINLKFTGDGLLDEDLTAKFHAAGIIPNLFNARQSALKSFNDGNLKKS
jgi:hypothetical protein